MLLYSNVHKNKGKLKKYADILAYPISLAENNYRLRLAWKMADVVPVSKEKPVEHVSKHLCPISDNHKLSHSLPIM